MADSPAIIPAIAAIGRDEFDAAPPASPRIIVPASLLSGPIVDLITALIAAETLTGFGGGKLAAAGLVLTNQKPINSSGILLALLRFRLRLILCSLRAPRPALGHQGRDRAAPAAQALVTFDVHRTVSAGC